MFQFKNIIVSLIYTQKLYDTVVILAFLLLNIAHTNNVIILLMVSLNKEYYKGGIHLL